jgi:hypothetical protein
MSFALVNFYEEDSWDVVRMADVSLQDEQKAGTMMDLEDVNWKSDSMKKAITAPAEIMKVSGTLNKIYLIILYVKRIIDVINFSQKAATEKMKI